MAGQQDALRGDACRVFFFQAKPCKKSLALHY
jgi:hypothetical protein